MPAPLRGRGLGLSVVVAGGAAAGAWNAGFQSLPGKGSCFWLRWPQDAEQWQTSSIAAGTADIDWAAVVCPLQGTAWSWKTMRSWPRYCWRFW